MVENYQNPEEALPREPLDYRGLLLGQLRGISAFTTSSANLPWLVFVSQYQAATDFLVILLLPFHDDAFKASLQKTNAEEKARQAPLHPDHWFQFANQYTTQRLEAAVLLMHRKGLLVKQSVGEEIEADELPAEQPIAGDLHG